MTKKKNRKINKTLLVVIGIVVLIIGSIMITNYNKKEISFNNPTMVNISDSFYEINVD